MSTQSSEQIQPNPMEVNKDSPEPITIDENIVLKELSIHKCFRLPAHAPGVEVTDLPNFDDVTPYGATDEVQQQLWELETKRLVKAVTEREPLRFRGSMDLAIDSKEAYAILASLADRVMQALTIISHDGESMLAEHHRSLFSKTKWRDSQISLGYMCDKEDDRDAGERRPEEAAKGNTEDFFRFVDYCTAITARFLCSATEGTSVHVNILAHMAKITTKIKVVAADFKRHAQVSLDNGVSERQIAIPDEHGVRGLNKAVNLPTMSMAAGKAPGQKPTRETADSPEEFADAYMDRLIESLESRTLDRMAPLETATKKKALRIIYYQRCDSYRCGLVGMLEGFLVHLRGTSKLTQTFSTSYEISGMVYETGFERFRTLVFQDEEHNFNGTSDALIVNYARNGFHLLNQTLEKMQAEMMPEINTPDEHDAVSIGTAISWNYTPDSPNTGPKSPSTQARHIVKRRSMSDTITVLVPLLLANPSRACSVSNFFNRITFVQHLRLHSQLTEEDRNVPFKPYTYPDYTAYFSLSTEEYRVEQCSRPLDGPKSLSNALMRRNNLHRGDGITALPRVSSNACSTPDLRNTGSLTSRMADQSALERIESRRQELDRVGNMMKSWVFEENGVMVTCKAYVALTMLFCAVLVGGGIAVGATVGTRITAVDPFNVTMYCWVLAAFVLLVAKSVRVHDWPWNDFLHWRVLCRSVSELSSVTGIDDQLILAKLLQDEAVSCLDTRGPFNTVFCRRSGGGDGFSIDRPIGMWAMLVSGLIMIEVESMNGRGLVCLDLRRGTRGAVIKCVGDYYKCDPEDRPSYIYCNRIPERKCKEREAQGEQGHGNPCKLVLNCGDILWMRALGFYSNKDALFI